VLAWPLPTRFIDWQPRAAGELWRWWTAAWVHWSALHLAGNLLALLLVAALGVRAEAGPRLAAAWFAAWPLTHLALLLVPGLNHYGGLSGVLHAGVAAASLGLALRAQGRRRAIGAAILAGMVVKLVLEEPWGPAVRHVPGWDIALAPAAHATGTLAGLLCAALALAWPPRPGTRRAL
jgi:rhomboid family GlyGly-CTERM serine protease